MQCFAIPFKPPESKMTKTVSYSNTTVLGLAQVHAHHGCSVTTSDTFGHFRPLGLKGYAVQRHFWHFFQFVKQNRPKMSLVVTLHSSRTRSALCGRSDLRCHRILLKSVVTLGLKGYVFYRIKPT